MSEAVSRGGFYFAGSGDLPTVMVPAYWLPSSTCVHQGSGRVQRWLQSDIRTLPIVLDELFIPNGDGGAMRRVHALQLSRALEFATGTEVDPGVVESLSGGCWTLLDLIAATMVVCWSGYQVSTLLGIGW
jgi:hypothetical protein